MKNEWKEKTIVCKKNYLKKLIFKNYLEWLIYSINLIF